MAAITSTMDRVVVISRKHNQIMRILINSLLAGLAGYLMLVLAIVGSFYIISSFYDLQATRISSVVLIISSLVYLGFYSSSLIKEMRSNNFCK